MLPRGGPVRFLRDHFGMRSYEYLSNTQWNDAFAALMNNRLIMGGLRYGPNFEPGKPKYDRVKSIQKRIAQYAVTGNAEHLVDVANEAMLEFTDPSNPNYHFEASDDTGVHTEVADPRKQETWQ